MPSDHPRVCGEHDVRQNSTSISQGSSPRMRGARAPSAVCCLKPGIIPAYAGSTDEAPGTSREHRDHPRVCGEHLAALALFAAWGGSSPRMRGAPKQLVGWLGREGIIPAYAGSTRRPGAKAARRRDHPRVCGEHTLTKLYIRCAWGSSPRMRGARRSRNGMG